MIFCEFSITTSYTRSFSYSISPYISYCFRTFASRAQIRAVVSATTAFVLLAYTQRSELVWALSETSSFRSDQNYLQMEASSRMLFSCFLCNLSFSFRYSFYTYRFSSFSRQISLSFSASCAVLSQRTVLLLAQNFSISDLSSSIIWRCLTFSTSAVDLIFLSCSSSSLALRFSLSISRIFSMSWWLLIWYSMSCYLCCSISAWFSLSLEFRWAHSLVSLPYFQRSASSQRDNCTIRFCQKVYSFIIKMISAAH